MSQSILPAGLSFKEQTEPMALKLAKAGTSEPWFTVYVNRLGVEDFRRLTLRNRRPAGIREGSKADREYDAKFAEALIRKAVDGWSGLTVANLETILPPKFKLEVDGKDPDYEIPFTVELAVWIHSNAFGDRWADPLMNALREGVDEEVEDEEEAKND